jgi:hypothetical protein
MKANVVKASDFKRAVVTTEEEINARLAVEDWPIHSKKNPN